MSGITHVLGGAGKVIQPVMFGGKNAHFQRVHGDIVACYQYINDERAMVLYPREKKMAAGAFIVCDSSAWTYNPDLPRSEWHDAQGNLIAGPHHLVRQAIVAARVMGMDTTRATIMRIATIIAEGLGDLVRMGPQRPQEQKKPIGEATLLIGGKPVASGKV